VNTAQKAELEELRRKLKNFLWGSPHLHPGSPASDELWCENAILRMVDGGFEHFEQVDGAVWTVTFTVAGLVSSTCRSGSRCLATALAIERVGEFLDQFDAWSTNRS
jgi:hypothetical protein